MIYDRLADIIEKNPKKIVGVWVVVLLISSVFAVGIGDVLSYDSSELVPNGAESMIGQQVMDEYFPDFSLGKGSTAVIVVPYGSPEEIPDALVLIQALKDSTGSQRHITDIQAMDPTSYTSKGIILGIVIAEGAGDWMESTQEAREYIDAIKAEIGYDGQIYVTGVAAIMTDMLVNTWDDISKIDPFTILLILLFIGLFFRSFVTSAVPPAVIGAGFIVTTALMVFIGTYLNLFFITEVLILVTMMGAGCDYCIFILSRYKEELRAGKSHEDALHAAIVWAGESITISGVAVVICFGCLMLFDYQLFSVMGLCMALGILIALLAALTLIPSILALVGDRVFWPTVGKEWEEGGKATKGWYARCGSLAKRYFDRSARFSVKHAKAIVVAAMLVTVPAAYVVTTTTVSYDLISATASGESGKGMEYIETYADQSLILPYNTLIGYEEPIAEVMMPASVLGVGLLMWNDIWYDRVSGSLDDLYADIYDDVNVATVQGPVLWEDMLRMIDDVGLSDATAEEKIEFLKSTLPNGFAMFVNTFVDRVESLGLGLDVIFMSLSEIVDEYAFSLFPEYDLPSWDILLQNARDAGLEDPSDIVDHVKDEVITIMKSQGDTDDAQRFRLGLETIRMLVSDEVLVYGLTPVIDYYINTSGGFLGGTFVQDRKVVGGDVSIVCIATGMGLPALSPRSLETAGMIHDLSKNYVVENQDIVVASFNTGFVAQMYDVSETVNKEFTTIEVVVVISIILMMLVVMRSYLIPLRSVLSIGMSVIWTLAVVYLVFINVLGGEVSWLLPILLVMVCLGLGLDYDILLTTRIKENRLISGMSNDDAIHDALLHTGSVITVCGLIMGCAFGTLMLSGMTLFVQLGMAMFIAILCDALVVRTYIVPAMMHLLGDWSWKGPSFGR